VIGGGGKTESKISIGKVVGKNMWKETGGDHEIPRERGENLAARYAIVGRREAR